MPWITPEWLWALNGQNLYTLYTYTLDTYPQGPNFICFTLRPAACDIQSCRNRKRSEWPETELEHLTIEGTLHTLNAYPRGPNFHLFALHLGILEIQCCRKSEMHWMTSDWLWTLNCQKWLGYINYLALRPKFHSTVAPFELTAVFCWFPYMLQWWMWNFRKKVIKHRGKFKFQKFNRIPFWGPLKRKFRMSWEKLKTDLQE